jgi:hypothetical protein
VKKNERHGRHPAAMHEARTTAKRRKSMLIIKQKEHILINRPTPDDRIGSIREGLPWPPRHPRPSIPPWYKKDIL